MGLHDITIALPLCVVTYTVSPLTQRERREAARMNCYISKSLSAVDVIWLVVLLVRFGFGWFGGFDAFLIVLFSVLSLLLIYC